MEIKNYLFRGFALFVFLLGVFLVPIKEANALSMTEFNARLSQLQQQFKDGEYWHYADNVSGDIRGGSTGYTLLYTSSRPHPEEPRFRLVARDEGSFRCFVGKEFWAFPSHLKRRRSPQETREELQHRSTSPSHRAVPRATVL